MITNKTNDDVVLYKVIELMSKAAYFLIPIWNVTASLRRFIENKKGKRIGLKSVYQTNSLMPIFQALLLSNDASKENNGSKGHFRQIEV